MIRKIILENYMAHVRTVIEPAAGLTVLIGPNNCGKSAVVHALEMVCYNSDAASFAVRHGTKKATVTIEIVDDDGAVHTIVWWRTKSTGGYVIDGREISGMGKGKTPEDLHRYLQMPEIESASGTAFRLHFGLQKEPIFLLDDPPSRAAQFFASSSDADRLMEMQRRHKQKEANARRDRERLDQEISRLDVQLSDLSTLTELSSELANLEAGHAAVGTAGARLAVMNGMIVALAEAARVERNYADRKIALSALQSPPAFAMPEALAKQIDAITAAAKQAAVNHAKRSALADLNTAPELIDTSRLAGLIANLRTASTRHQREANRMAATASLQAVPTQEDANSLSVLIDAMASAIDRRNRLEARHQLLEKLLSIPTQTDASPLADLVERLEKSTSRLVETQKSLLRAEKNLAAHGAQVARFVEENPLCESCGQSVSAELIIQVERLQSAEQEISH